LKIVRTVGTAMNARISAGMAVQRISSVVTIVLAPPSEAEDRVQQDAFDEDEDRCSEIDEDFEQKADVAIELRVVVEDGVRVASVARGEGHRGEGRQRGGGQPAQSGRHGHARSLFRQCREERDGSISAALLRVRTATESTGRVR
jgi:hypothetical protein